MAHILHRRGLPQELGLMRRAHAPCFQIAAPAQGMLPMISAQSAQEPPGKTRHITGTFTTGTCLLDLTACKHCECQDRVSSSEGFHMLCTLLLAS